MRKHAFLSCLALLSGFAAPLAAQDNITKLQPSSAWAMDYADDRCRLARAFGEGDDQISIALERFQPGEPLRLILIGKAIKAFRNADSFGYRWGPDGTVRDGMLLRSTTGDGQGYFDLGITSLTPPPEMPASPPPAGTPPESPRYDPGKEAAAGSQITELAVSGGVSQPFALETGKMSAPIKAMQACSDELVKFWGLDPVALREASRSVLPAGDISKWVRSGLVPFSDFAKLPSTDNYLRLMVDETGKLTGCHFLPTAPAAEFLAKACEDLKKNAAFTPALNAAGQPIKSFWFTNLYAFMPMPGGRR